MTFDQSLTGDPLEGEKLISAGQSMCLACHTIKGNPMMQAILGPDLTHIASRTTIAAGLYPNDKQHLELLDQERPRHEAGRDHVHARQRPDTTPPPESPRPWAT